MRDRKVIPEILDSLPPEDPRAIRSRRDLRWINSIMGNYRWIARRVRDTTREANLEWYEAGAGDGHLADFFSPEERTRLSITGMDLIPRSPGWPEQWAWRQGDIFDGLGDEPEAKRGLIANLFLHHFERPDLERLGEVIDRDCVHLVISEPARYAFFHGASHLFDPFVNSVTRYDMRVSIGAGFRRGELVELLGLEGEWTIHESTTLLGAYRLEAWRSNREKSLS